MFFAAETAWRKKQVNMRGSAFEQRRVAPKLRRAGRAQGAGKASWAVAGGAVVFPKHVDRADQPVLVRSVELDHRVRRLNLEYAGPE